MDKASLIIHVCVEQNGVSTARQSARDKLTKLYAHQFEELSTDVFDEMNRRISDGSVPFLAVQSDFHPKRNQARQKLATLSVNRFKDLASDVYFELQRRYPDAVRANGDGPSKSSGHVEQEPPSYTPGPAGKSRSGSVSKEPMAPQRDIKSSFATSSSAVSENKALPPSQPPVVAEEKSSQHEQQQEDTSVGDVINKDEKDPFGLNFQTLDNLMADLGSMIATSLDEQQPSNSARSRQLSQDAQEPVVPTRSSFQRSASNNNNGGGDSQMHILASENSKLAQVNARLDADNQKLDARIRDLEQELDRVRRELDAVTQSREDSRREYEESLMGLKAEIKELQKKISDVNVEKYEREIDSLSETLKKIDLDRDALQRQLAGVESEKDTLASRLAESESANATLRAEIANLHQSMESIKKVKESNAASFDSLREMASRKSAPLTDENYDAIPRAIDLSLRSLYSDSGFVHKVHVTDFKQSIGDLLKAARVDTPAAVLIAMKSIVVSTRHISDGLERYETSAKNPRLDTSSSFRSNISTRLTNLMTAAKNHATGVAGSLNIVDCSRELVSAILDAVTLVQISKGLSMDKLKSFLEQQTDLIVQNIQTLLQAMRQAEFGAEFRQTITNITNVVENLIHVSRSSLDQTEYEAKSEVIIKNLADSNMRLSDMGDGMLSEKKPSKQRLAGAAYEVAKYTKELVSLFDIDP
eukprot:Partr_v1_DN26791_c0_g1_i1_m8372 putative cell polarity protein